MSDCCLSAVSGVRLASVLLTMLRLGSDLCLGAVDYAVWRLTCVSLLLTMLFWDLTCVSVLCLGSDLCLGAVSGI